MIQIYEKIVDSLALLAVVLLLAIMVGIGADVGARYFFNDPIGWMLEFVQHSLLCILFLGMPWLTREGGHVSIELLVDALPVRERRLLIAAGLIVAGVTSGFIGYWAILVTADNFRRGVETSGIYPIPRAWLLAVIALGLCLSAVEFVRKGYRTYNASDDEIMKRNGELGVEP